MFDNAVSLNPGSYGGANVAKVYDLIAMSSPSSIASTRRVSATSTTTPETLVISHRESKVGGVPTDQHMVRLDTVFQDPIQGQVKLSSWMCINVPKNTTVVTLQHIKDMVGRLIAFEQAAGALDKILNSEP